MLTCKIYVLCPVCSYGMFSERGCSEICGWCRWEDDLVQFEEPDYRGGANEESLNEARQIWQEKQERRELELRKWEQKGLRPTVSPRKTHDEMAASGYTIPCPVCGTVINFNKGDYEYCSYCRWTDDPLSYERPDFRFRENKISLNEARKSWPKRKKKEQKRKISRKEKKKNRMAEN